MQKLFLLTITLLIAIHAVAQNNTGTKSNKEAKTEVRISGTVTDRSSNRKLENVSITIQGTNISTVTNADGFFLLKLKHRPQSITVSCIGYASENITIADDRTENIRIKMLPTGITLPELNVWLNEPEALVMMAIERRDINFVQTREMHTSFYRETLQKGNRYIDISEAILSTCKRGYDRGITGDRVKIKHGRRIMSQRNDDTLSVQILGGPNTPVWLDVVKNENILFEDMRHSCYTFNMELPEVLDGKTQIVIAFAPYLIVEWPLYRGKIYLDKQSLAFTRIEMELDMSDRAKATRVMLYKKPASLRFRPLEMSTVINYHDGRINYMKTVFRFKCDWKRKLFSRTYRCTSEMVVTDFETNYEGPNIEAKERFGDREAFIKTLKRFSDASFWDDYNIIEPTESLEKAILKINKR